MFNKGLIMENSSKCTFEQIVTKLEENDVETLTKYIRDNTGFANDVNQYYNNKKRGKTELSVGYLINNYAKLKGNLAGLDPIYIKLMISLIDNQKQFTTLTEKSIPITLSMVAIFISSASLLNSITNNDSSLSAFFKIFGCLLIVESMWRIYKLLRLNGKIRDTYFKNRNMDMLLVLLKNCNDTSKN